MRTTVRPPSERHVANVKRKSNPFALDDEPDWVPSRGSGTDAVSDQKPPPPPPPPPRQRTIDESAATIMDHGPPAVPRKPLSLSSQTSHGGPSPRLPTTQQQSASSRNSSLSSQTAQASTAFADLLGDTTGEQIGWKPLLPERGSQTPP